MSLPDIKKKPTFIVTESDPRLQELYVEVLEPEFPGSNFVTAPTFESLTDAIERCPPPCIVLGGENLKEGSVSTVFSQMGDRLPPSIVFATGKLADDPATRKRYEATYPNVTVLGVPYAMENLVAAVRKNLTHSKL